MAPAPQGSTGRGPFSAGSAASPRRAAVLAHPRYAAFGDLALAAGSTARAPSRTLREAAAVYTDPGHPHGRLFVLAAVGCSAPEVAECLRERRNAAIAAFESRTRAGVAAGELPADTDATALARHADADPGHVPAGP